MAKGPCHGLWAGTLLWRRGTFVVSGQEPNLRTPWGGVPTYPLPSRLWGQAYVLTYHEQGHSDILLPLLGFQQI